MATINFSGIASGIDASALIKALLDQKRKTQIRPLETKVSNLEETNKAFEKLSDLLKNLQTAASKFREISGGVLAKNLVSSNEAILTGSASNSAAIGTHSFNVLSLAKNATHSFDDRFDSSSSIINPNINNADNEADRTITYTIGSGAEEETINIVLTDTTTAGDLVSQFNSQSSKAAASLVNVGTSAAPSYAIVVNSNNQGLEKGSISVSVGSSITDPNGDLSNDGGVFLSDTLSQASNAEFTLSGIDGIISRASNSVSDVIAGISLNLQSTGSASITIGDDSAKTTTSMQEFVEAYNEVVKYIQENDKVTREENGKEVNNIFGSLARTSIDNSIITMLRSALSASGTGGGHTVNIFADMGITTARDGTLDFDTEKFKEALSSDSEGVRKITEKLGEDLSAVNGKIAQYIRFNGLIDIEKNSNSSQIRSANSRISDLEANLGREEQNLTVRFSKLEALIGRLNSQQNMLASLLPRNVS